jgi:microcystin-dependent protein
LNLTERSTSPSSPSSGDIYLDDGTNCTDGSNPCLRRYTGAAWEDINNTGSGSPYTGDYKWSAQTADHGNWLLCDGGTVLRSSSLGTLLVSLGLPFGVGDGSTTVNIPDPAGRSLLAAGSGSGLTTRSIGDSGGEETHQLTISEMPAHTHDAPNSKNFITSTGSSGAAGGGWNSVETSTASTGGDGSHNTMHPFLAVGNLFIYAGS